jgi:hypothetical protein
MTTMSCALVVGREAIPQVADVVRRVAEHGHTITFHRGFDRLVRGRAAGMT